MAFTYTRNFTDEEEKIMHDRISVTIQEWVDNAIAGKLNSALKEGAKRRRDELIEKGASTIPATDLELLRNAFADPGYKNAKQRGLST